MKTPNNLEQIAEYIDAVAQEQEKELSGFQEEQQKQAIQEVRKLIEKFSISDTKSFTFTVGELNAYLG